jgi:hypothetical protein
MYSILLAVSLGNPRLYLKGHLFNGRYPSPKALPADGAYFQFRHIEPRAVFGCMMDFKALPKPPRLFRFKHGIQGSQTVGIQVVHNQNDFFRVRIVVFSHVAQAMGEIFTGAPLCYQDFPPLGKGLKHHKQIANPIADILIIILGALSRLDGSAFPGFPDELPVRLIKAHYRTFFVIRESVGLQYILHPFHVFGGRRGYAPLFL